MVAALERRYLDGGKGGLGRFGAWTADRDNILCTNEELMHACDTFHYF
jgi:hypothetical protein